MGNGTHDTVRSPHNEQMISVDSHQWKPGEILLDEYKVKSVINQGGMGRVYLVQRVLDHALFAVKTLRSSVSKEPAAIHNFIRELRVWIDYGAVFA